MSQRPRPRTQVAIAAQRYRRRQRLLARAMETFEVFRRAVEEDRARDAARAWTQCRRVRRRLVETADPGQVIW